MTMGSAANFWWLFAPYNSPMSTSWPPPGKRQRNQGDRSSWFPPQGTWTHNFLCLRDKHTNEIPSGIKEVELQENVSQRRMWNYEIEWHLCFRSDCCPNKIETKVQDHKRNQSHAKAMEMVKQLLEQKMEAAIKKKGWLKNFQWYNFPS